MTMVSSSSGLPEGSRELLTNGIESHPWPTAMVPFAWFAWLWRLGIFTGLALCAAHGRADAPSDGYQASRVIEEVVVTARKREESLQEAPIAITAFGAEQISRNQIDSLDDIAMFTPGLMIGDGSGSQGGTIYMRGVGNGDLNQLQEQAIAINVDGMQVGSLNIRKTSQIDLEQIEVLRGPQALFFGRNSPGGVISMRTADPTEDVELSTTVAFEAESEDRYIEAVASGPLNDRVGARLVVRYTDMEGYLDLKTAGDTSDPYIVPPSADGWPSGDEVFVRGTLTAAPTDNLDIRAKLSYNKVDIKGGSTTAGQRFSCPYGAPQGQPNFPCKLDQDVYLGGGPPEFFGLVPDAPTLDALGLRENDQILGTLEFNYSLTPSLDFTSITGFFDLEELNSHNGSRGPRTFLAAPYIPYDLRQYTQEFRLASNWSSPVNFMLGLFGERRDQEVSVQGIVAFPPLLIPFPVEVLDDRLDAYSVFWQFQWDVTDRLEISGGLRYTKESRELKFYFNGTDVTGNLAHNDLSFDNVSPELTVSYFPQDDLMVYVSYKEGFKPGGFDGSYTNGRVLLPGYQNAYDEETISGFELGAKAVLANQTLSLNLALYHYDYEDMQVGTTDPLLITYRVVNAGESELQGFEADFDWIAPIEGLSFQGYVAYNDAKFKEFLSDCYVGQTIVLGCNLTPDPNTGVFLQQDLAGRNLNNAPEWTGSLGATYERDIGGLLLTVAVNSVYSSDYYGNQRLSPQDEQDSYTKLYATLSLSSLDERWELALIGRNLTDEYSINTSSPVSLTGGGTGTATGVLSDRAAYGSKGRELFLRASYSF